MEYWLDYDANVREGLETALANQWLFCFKWTWGALKNGEVSEYEANPEQGLVIDRATKQTRKLRRFFIMK